MTALNASPSPSPRRLYPRHVRMAFGGDPAHPFDLGVLLAVDGTTVTLGLLTDEAVYRFVVPEPERLAAVLGRRDLCRLDGRPLVLVNRHYQALGIAVGPPVPPDQLSVCYGVCRIEDGAAVEIPGNDGQPSWHVFALDEGAA